MNVIEDELNLKIELATLETPPSSSTKMYRVVNTKGEVYSHFNGWQVKSGKLKGHCFDGNGVKVVKEILEAAGYVDIRIEGDKVATNFVRAATYLSVFNSPKFIIYSILFLIAVYVIISAGALELLTTKFEDSITVITIKE